MNNNKLIAQTTKEVIDNWVKMNNSFTAHDVTDAVRNRLGMDVNVDHGDVNGTVRYLFLNGEMGNYKREVDNNLGVSPSPFRYHPKSYKVPTKFFKSKSDNKADYIRILKNTVNEAKLNSGDIVNVVYSPQFSSIYLSKRNIFTNDPNAISTNYSVDSKLNIRINKGVLGCNDRDVEEIGLDSMSGCILVQLTN